MRKFLCGLFYLSLCIGALIFSPLHSLVLAQNNEQIPVSTCMAIANTPRLPIQKASFQLAQIEAKSVRISYVGHSTFRLQTNNGPTIATDFAGFAGLNIVPDVVTMNHAHSTHFTIAPDPRIDHVLRGWGSNGAPAKHFLNVDDTIIRNVTTDINSEWAGFEENGNSIFIFETHGLCIGHLGHLHHRLTQEHYAAIGRLDIVMVPVDGGYTMSVEDMAAVVKRLRASMVLPMHWFGSFSLQRFLTAMGEQFPVDVRNSNMMDVSLNSLPVEPTIVVLQPESSGFGYGGD